MKPDRVAITGYYGYQNTGDDALLAVSSWGCREHFRAKEIYAFAANLPVFGGSEFVTLVSPRRRFKGEAFLRQCFYLLRSDMLIFGGGSIFSFTEPIKQNIKMLDLVKKGHNAALGVSIGPFRDNSAEIYCSQLLNRLSYVGVRDQASYEIARAISSTPHVEKTFDLAILLPKASGTNLGCIKTEKTTKGIGLAMCYFERYVGGNTMREDLRKKKIIQVLKKVMSEVDDELYLIDFNGHPRFGDFALHHEISTYVQDFCRVRHVRYSTNPLKTLREIASLRVLIGMRLHAVIFGYLSGTPTLMLSYHKKCLEWALQSKMSEESVFDSTEFDTNKLVAATLQAYFKKLSPPKFPLEEAEKLAMKNWTWMEETTRMSR